MLLVSCSATRYTAAPEAEELTHYVLVIEELSGGQIIHDWRRSEDVDLSRYRYIPQEFSVVDDAVDWLKSNQQAILVGSVVIIAGVAFVTVSAGSGLVILAPAVLLAS